MLRAVCKSAPALLLVSVAAGKPPAPFPGERSQAVPSVIRVGPGQKLRSLGAAAKLARAGDTIELEPGDYVADAAVLDKDGLRVVGVKGRARFIARGAHAEGKGLLVVRAQNVVIENVEITGTRVPDHYGSGIRLERGSLRVVNSRFHDNELSIMTANDPAIVLEIEGCEFSGLVETGRRDEALSHSVYAGTIDWLRVQNSYFHDGSVGHLLKSRARNNEIRYNRLSDENGKSSYELEFPAGGNAVVVGNIIQQGPRTENSTLLSYGAEGARWPQNRLDVLFNTFVNDYAAGGIFVAVKHAAAEVRIRNNLLLGAGSLELRAPADVASNTRANARDLVDPSKFDYRPRLSAQWVGSVSAFEHPFPEELLPAKEYRHPASARPLKRTSRVQPLSPGAIQTLGR